uniref:Glycosyl transferase family 25 domain-containing protein n=1 Tax=viral metagenome TaxID=1070528 RepID=A0A6C0I865_9ZZZZ
MNKINGISLILWINLDRSIERRKHMETTLKEIDVPNIRIEAIDSQTENINPLKCCTMSHLKAIKYLLNKPGDYFMICEDDVIFDNISYLLDLQTIIKNAPEFDILSVYKNELITEDNNYINWNYERKKGNKFTGAVCYIISKKGITNILNKNESFEEADIYLYKNVKSYVYKYNIVSTLNTDSTLHRYFLRLYRISQKNNLEQLKKLSIC